MAIYALSINLYSQGKIVWQNADGSEMGNTIEITRPKYHSDLVMNAMIANISDSDKRVLLKRTFQSYIASKNGKPVTDLLCYGSSCQSGSESNAILITSATELKSGAKISTTNPIDLIHFAPNENTGTAVINYYILTETDVEGQYQEEDMVTVKYTVSAYVRPEIIFKIDMSNAVGFNPNTYEVYVEIEQTGEKIVLTRKRGTNTYYKTVILDGAVSGSENYNYRYSVKSTEGDRTVVEAHARTLSVQKSAIELNDQWQVATNMDADAKEEPLKVYPVPFNDRLCIENSGKITKLELINLSGVVVYSSNPIAERHEIQTTSLKPGIYFMNCIKENGQKSTTRVIKTK